LLHRHALVASLFKKLAQQRHRPYRSIQVLIRPCLISANTNQIFRPCVRCQQPPHRRGLGSVLPHRHRRHQTTQRIQHIHWRVPSSRSHRPRQHHVPIQQRPHRIHHRILLIVSLHQHRIESRNTPIPKVPRPLHQL